MSSHVPHNELEPVPEAHFDEASTSLLQDVMAGRSPLEKIRNPEQRSRLELAQTAMEGVAVSIHELHTLTHEEQLEVLDKVVDSVFDQDEAAQDTIKQIQVAREARDEETIKTLTASQRERYTQLRRNLAAELGVEIEDTEQQNEDYRAELLKRVEGLSGATEEQIMRKLGFLVPDTETGKEKFNFPADIFPPHIVDKWKNYEQTIQSHVAASMRFNRALDDNSDEIVQLDALRRYAHNKLATSVQEFLKLEDWDFKRVRIFIAKLVEQRFPTVETKESEVTSKDVVERLRAIKALGSVVFHDED